MPFALSIIKSLAVLLLAVCILVGIVYGVLALIKLLLYLIQDSWDKISEAIDEFKRWIKSKKKDK